MKVIGFKAKCAEKVLVFGETAQYTPDNGRIALRKVMDDSPTQTVQ